MAATPAVLDHSQLQLLAALFLLLGESEAQRAAAACLIQFGSLSGILAATEADLLMRSELSPRIAGALQLLTQLFHRASFEELIAREPIGSFAALRLYALKRLRGRETEQLIMLLLDRKNGIIREHIVAEGNVDSIPLNLRDVVRPALLHNASGIILLHNHPTGNPTPSSQDITFTRSVAEPLAMMGIALHDHLIVGGNDTVSLRAEGLLN